MGARGSGGARCDARLGGIWEICVWINYDEGAGGGSALNEIAAAGASASASAEAAGASAEAGGELEPEEEYRKRELQELEAVT